MTAAIIADYRYDGSGCFFYRYGGCGCIDGRIYATSALTAIDRAVQLRWMHFTPRKSRLTGASAAKSGKFIILEISANSAFDTSKMVTPLCLTAASLIGRIIRVSTPTLSSLKKIATYIKNDTEGDDWIDYFPCG